MRWVRWLAVALALLLPLTAPGTAILAEDEPAEDQPDAEKPANEMSEEDREAALKRADELNGRVL